jgi:hypothetical protein
MMTQFILNVINLISLLEQYDTFYGFSIDTFYQALCVSSGHEYGYLKYSSVAVKLLIRIQNVLQCTLSHHVVTWKCNH